MFHTLLSYIVIHACQKGKKQGEKQELRRKAEQNQVREI